ncbi:RluA family pseudouridine synthase [Bacillus kexueae]|uniref:RluA family pseudouridine synthase n=1 Tax=Aeribacillus kexueae TaxID=2078952 RepID=UPI001FAE9C24|nr:RluA family pseudouridine synthase [Bacillus kexueae]
MIRKDQWMIWPAKSDWVSIPLQELLRTTFRVPKGLLHEWRMEKKVKVNGVDPNWTKPLTLGDELAIELFTKETDEVKPENLPLDILYEDDHLIIVNKPPYMNTHPNEEGETGTLGNALSYYFEAKGIKARHIHRLDQNTSGAIIFAKHRFAYALLSQDLLERKIKRTYVAIVHGTKMKESGTIDAPIGRDRHHPVRRRVSKSGQQAITHFHIVKKFPPKYSIVKLTLDTGRTHQIRVHLSSIGHPIVGDQLYGGKTNNMKRQALHAENISLIHPFTNEKIKVEAPLPSDMKALIRNI